MNSKRVPKLGIRCSPDTFCIHSGPSRRADSLLTCTRAREDRERKPGEEIAYDNLDSTSFAFTYIVR